jgi:hypothetical protein
VQTRKAILSAFKTKRPVFLWGPPGIGKSEVVQEIADELKGHVIDLRMAQMEPTDIRGIPFFNRENGKMDWAEPVELPTKEMAEQYPVITLFLDEMNVAAPAVQAAAYQLILNRRLGTYFLPDNVVIVAAGNRESDKGVSFRMPMPLANRFVHLEVRADYDSWNEWAVQNREHKDVVGYIGFAKQDLMDFNPRSASRAFATPRSWHFVSEFLHDEDATDAELSDLIAGTIGDGLAVKFMAHRKVASKMPNPSEILAGKVKTLDVKEVSAMYSLTVSMCYELQDAYAKLGKEKISQWHGMADNFFRFMMDNFTTELVVMGARVALTTYNLPLVPGKLKNFDEFHKRYGKYIIAAGGK